MANNEKNKKPIISALRAYRCSWAGELDRNGDNIIVSFAWITKPNNVKRIYASYTGMTGKVEISASGQNGNVHEIISNNDIKPNQSYTITIEVTSSYTDDNGSTIDLTTTEICNLKDKIYLIDFRAGGQGMSIGKEAELDGYFDVELDTKLRSLHFPNSYSIYGITNEYGDVEAGLEYEVFTAMSTANNTTMGYGIYANRIGDSRIYGNDVWLCSAKAGGTVDEVVGYRPYYRAGDTININITTTGYLTSGRTKVYFTVSLDKPILGSPIIKLSNPTNGGFILRQLNPTKSVTSSSTTVTKLDTGHTHTVEHTHNGRYSHGSNINSGVYTFVKTTTLKQLTQYGTSTASGISVEATFAEDTEASNNTPIAVDWVGTIKLEAP